jgi:hypothetical protein
MTKQHLNLSRIVEVEWVDAEESGSVGWNDIEEMVAYSTIPCPIVKSVGYVIFEDEAQISLIRSWHSGGLSSVEKIPKGWVRSIRPL